MKKLIVLIAFIFCSQSKADDWSNWQGHMSASAQVGLLTYAALPDLPWYAQELLCLVPGARHELQNRKQPGGWWSARDMWSNAAGCGLALGTAHLIKINFAPGYLGVGYVIPLN